MKMQTTMLDGVEFVPLQLQASRCHGSEL